MVVGEFERAFTEDQFQQVVGLLRPYGVTVWLPEAAGPVDVDDPAHRVLMNVLAAQSQREVVRARHQTLAAMTVQTVEQGRFLGGRPPYGYRLVTRVSIRIGRTRRGAGGGSGCIRIRKPRGTCGGCSPSVLPGAAWRG